MTLPRWIKTLVHLQRLPEIWRAILWAQNWWQLTCAYLKLGKNEYPFKLISRSGLEVELNNYHDCVTAWVIFCRHEYSVPANANVVIDLGANFGAFTLLAAQRAKNSHIVSLEPFPKTFKRLDENIQSHGLTEQVTCLPLAIANTSGQRKMSTSEDVPDQSRGLLSENSVSDEEAVVVETISFGELLKFVRQKLGVEKIDLVKMDIEGGEHEWLPEISENLLENIQAWQMEYHPNGSKQPLFQALKTAGFCCVSDFVIAPDCGVAHFERKRK